MRRQGSTKAIRRMEFEFAPTAYEIERQKQAKMSPKRLAQEGKKQLGIAIRNYNIRGITTGQQFTALKHVERVASEYGIELDVYYRWMLALHRRHE